MYFVGRSAYEGEEKCELENWTTYATNFPGNGILLFYCTRL